LTPCSLRCARRQALALRATPNGAARKILLLPPKKPVDLLHPLAAIAVNNKQEEIVMGLDSYAYIIEKSLVTSDVDFQVDQDALQQLHYWRKHHDLHGWMERLYIAKGGQNPQFNLSGLSLNSADLDALEKAVNVGDPPEAKGFRFGHSRRSELDEFIRQAREALKDGLAVIYVAWW
jgi:predicted nuclease of predicted toxin-antitoxin system